MIRNDRATRVEEIETLDPITLTLGLGATVWDKLEGFSGKVPLAEAVLETQSVKG